MSAVTRKSRLLLATFSLSVFPGGHLLAQDVKPSPRLFFPVRVEAPSIQGGTDLKPGDTIYSQRIRSRSAIKLTEDHLVRYEPKGLDGLAASGKATIPAGTVFVIARTGEGEMYCGVGSDGTESWTNYFDVGVCIQDVDRDGKFDREVVIGVPSWRQRIPYEMIGTGGRNWVPATVSYAPLPVDEIPVAELKVIFLSASSRDRNKIVISLVWPRSMVLETAGEKSGKWSANVAGMTPRFSGGKDDALQIDAGTLSLSLQFSAGPSVTATTSIAFAAGDGSMFLAGRVGSRADYKFQLPIVAVVPTLDVVSFPQMEIQ
jgi:hypothetical protein